MDSLGTLVRSFDKRGKDGGVGGMTDLTDSLGSSDDSDSAGSAAREGRLSWHSAPSVAIAVVERHLLPLAMTASLYAGCAAGQPGSTEACHVPHALHPGCCLLNSDQVHGLHAVWKFTDFWAQFKQKSSTCRLQVLNLRARRLSAHCNIKNSFK